MRALVCLVVSMALVAFVEYKSASAVVLRGSPVEFRKFVADAEMTVLGVVQSYGAEGGGSDLEGSHGAGDRGGSDRGGRDRDDDGSRRGSGNHALRLPQETKEAKEAAEGDRNSGRSGIGGSGRDGNAAVGSTGMAATAPAQPTWQCLQYDDSKADAWCGSEPIQGHFGSLNVAYKASRPWLDFNGCGHCWCCMQRWPLPAASAVLPGGGSGPEDVRGAIRTSANHTFGRVVKPYTQRRVSLLVRGNGELDALRSAFRKDGSAVLQSDLSLSSGRVRRHHRLSSLQPPLGADAVEPPAVLVGRAIDVPATIHGRVVADFAPLPLHCPTKLWGLFPKWSAALEAKARERAVNGTLFFTLTDKQYESVMACWHWSVVAITGRENTLIIPTDEVTLRKCAEHKLPCVVADSAELPRINIWGDIGFLKFYSMALISGLGLDFIFAEMDVLVLQNPWPYHEREDKLQWSQGDCRHYPHTWPGRHPKENAQANEADIQVTAHFNHPRVNIGYIYARWTVASTNFFAQLFAYFVGKCADHVLGFDHREGTYVDLGLPDQNILDAFLRNHDHGHPKYADIPWDMLPALSWKLLDYNLFGIFGRHEARVPWVTFHYAGEGRKLVCWTGICEKMRRHQALDPAGRRPLSLTECIRPWQGAHCAAPKPGAARSLQGSLPDQCLGIRLPCSRER